MIPERLMNLLLKKVIGIILLYWGHLGIKGTLVWDIINGEERPYVYSFILKRN